MANDDETSVRRIRIGVSACLLGQEVRFDGGHKHDRFITDSLGRCFEFVSVCPEVELGLGTPRESLRLVQIGAGVHFVAPKSGTDRTKPMRTYSELRVSQLGRENLRGYILKKDSPSCGMERVRVHGAKGAATRKGRGLFAEALMRRFPHLPVEEEGRLHDAPLRENFVSRVFAYDRWLGLAESGLTREKLYRFHERHKYQLMAHNQSAARKLGALLGSAPGRGGVEKLARAYLEGFVEVMQRVPTRRSHTNVLQHLAGYVSDKIDAEDRAELAEMIHDYREGHLPLLVPVTLLRHWVRKLRVPYLIDQVYLSPHPDELMLLNQP